MPSGARRTTTAAPANTRSPRPGGNRCTSLVYGPLGVGSRRSVRAGRHGGVLPNEELLKNTDPAKVSFELDCGWVIVDGQDHVHYLKQYPTRIVMLHVKDFKDNKPPSVELGTGSVDYKPIFAAAAANGHIRHAFLEQGEFQGPIMEALKVDAEYMKRFRA